MKAIVSFLLRNVPRPVLQRIVPVGMQFMAWWYKGDKYTCPIDGRSYRKLMPYGRTNPRENALAPGSLSLERHRLLWLFLQRRTDFFSRKYHFLHIAPEACFMDRFGKMHGEGYITADIESPLAKVKMDVHDIPFPDNTFDAVMCNHVLEHVKDDLKAMSEIYRVIKPGGWAILQVPFFYPLIESTIQDPAETDPKKREERFGQDDHVRRYGKDYSDRLKSAGFVVTEDRFVDELSEEEKIRYAVMPNETIFFCHKRKGELHSPMDYL